MMFASFGLEWADSKGWGTNGKSWSQISRDKTTAIWDSIQSSVNNYFIESSKSLSNENQEFKFEPLI